MTNFESYPKPGTPECDVGCKYAGQFAFLDGKQSEEWVKSHHIIAVHHKHAHLYKLKTFKITQGKHHITAKVYDECRDEDCEDGECCTKNSENTGFLIDMEKYTLDEFGGHDGVVDWECIDC